MTASSEERTLLAAVAAAPGDDVPRLVYADWLDEHGRPERAEFIRLQIGWHRSVSDPTYFHARNRFYNRIFDHKLEYGDKCEDVPPLFDGVVWEAHTRGFVDTVVVSGWEVVAALSDVLAATTVPVTHLDYRYRSPAELSVLTDAIPRLTVRRLTADRCNNWPPGAPVDLSDDVRRLATVAWPSAVEQLRLGPAFSPAAAAVFLAVATDRPLPQLDLRAVRGLSEADRLRFRTRFGNRVLLP